MLDVEFLQKPKLGKHLVHLFNEGCFRPDVANEVRAAAEERGWMWQEFDPNTPAVIAGGMLYDAVLLAVDLDAVLRNGMAESVLRSMAACLKASPETHFFAYGCGGPGLAGDAWDAVLDAAAVIHEPELSVAAIPRLLSYVGPRLALSLDRVANRPDLENSLRGWVGHGGLSLRQFLSWLDVLVVGCVDQNSGTFDPVAFDLAVSGTQPLSPVGWIGALARFLRTASGRDRIAFLSEIDRGLNERDMKVREVLGAIYRATFDLAKANDLLNPDPGIIPDGWTDPRWQRSRAHRSLRLPTLLRWQTLLAHHEPALIQHGLVAWDALLRQMDRVEKS